MSNVQIQVVSVQSDIQIPKKDGGSYAGTQLVYNAGGRTMTKGFAKAFIDNNVQLKAKLEALKAGEAATLVLEKKGAFTNVVDILEAGAAPPASSGSSYSSSGSSHKSKGSTKETARIVRQTAVTAAAAFEKTPHAVMETAELLSEFILAPLGVDSMGNEIKTEVKAPEKADVTETDNDVPF